MHEVDSREMPVDWEYVKISLSSSKYNHKNPNSSEEYLVFKLNQALTDWAYRLTRHDQLKDYPELQEFRKQFKGYPNAEAPIRIKRS